MTPKEYFEQTIPKNLSTRKEVLSSINSIYEFQITGPSGGTWVLDLTVPGGKVTTGSAGDGKAHCTVTIEDENFLKLISGKLNPQMAFMTGKLKVAGNMGLALKLQKIL